MPSPSRLDRSPHGLFVPAESISYNGTHTASARRLLRPTFPRPGSPFVTALVSPSSAALHSPERVHSERFDSASCTCGPVEWSLFPHHPRQRPRLYASRYAILGAQSTMFRLATITHNECHLKGGEARTRIVEHGAGGFCFATNATFAQGLRGMGFRVSECVTRCYLGRA